jgi:alpha-glucosidase (family GH31 glycosyl hydrolase)
LLPYYYTLFYNASLLGETVARPLLFEFPTDPATFSVDQQFLVGPALLISPVLQQGATSVKAYFPGNDVWYDFYTHAPVTKGSPQFLVLDTPLNKIQVSSTHYPY